MHTKKIVSVAILLCMFPFTTYAASMSFLGFSFSVPSWRDITHTAQTLFVGGATPQVQCTLNAAPLTITEGDSATLSWSLSNFEHYAAKNFAINVVGTPVQSGQQTIDLDCSSRSYQYTECKLGVPIASVISIRVIKQYSYCSKQCPTDSTPLEGTNYGIKNGNVFWVDHGYRARFQVVYIAPATILQASGTATVTPRVTTVYTLTGSAGGNETGTDQSTLTRDCSSLNYTYTECPLNVPIARVVSIGIVKQYSYCSKQCPTDSTPMEGTNYGIKNGNVLWVAHGYRAKFLITYIPQATSSSALCSATVTVVPRSGLPGTGRGSATSTGATGSGTGDGGIGEGGGGDTGAPSYLLNDTEGSISAWPTLVRSGGVCALTFSGTNVTGCELSGGGMSLSIAGDANGRIASTSINSLPISSDTTFTWSCTGKSTIVRTVTCKNIPVFQEF